MVRNIENAREQLHGYFIILHVPFQCEIFQHTFNSKATNSQCKYWSLHAVCLPIAVWYDVPYKPIIVKSYKLSPIYTSRIVLFIFTNMNILKYYSKHIYLSFFLLFLFSLLLEKTFVLLITFVFCFVLFFFLINIF